MAELTQHPVPGKTLALFSRFIARSMGIHFSGERLPELERKMAGLCGAFGFDDPEACMIWLMSAPLSREQLETLAGSLTIGETYFFRDPRSFSVLEDHVLPELIRERMGNGEKRIRIWSAGCSTGEEPYSIAILLDRIIPDLRNWNITLLATDINPRSVERGRSGVYGRWSFRDPPPWFMEYFREVNRGRFEIIPRIRKMVRFSCLNLAEESYPSLFNNTNAMDIIFCRNVMLYFDRASIDRVTARFRLSLLEGGWLFVSPSEAPHGNFEGFACRRFEGAFVYRKGAGKEDGRGMGGVFAAISCGSGIEPAAVSPVFPAVGEGEAREEVHPVTESAAEPAAGEIIDPDAPKSRDLIYREACALYGQGRYELAAAMAAGIAEGEKSADVMELLARSYASMGRFAEARECCEAAIAADRLRAQSHYLLAAILDEEGRPGEAEEAFKRTLYIDHDHILAYFALANLGLKGGRKGEARRNFRNALELLERRDPCESLPEADGLTAGRLAEIIRAMDPGRSVNE